MPGEGSFTSFKELARHARAEELKQGLRRDSTPTKESNRELFHEVLEGNFGDVPPGEFIVDRQGIDTVSIGRIGQNLDDPEQLFATFFYRHGGGKQASFTWSIGRDGTFSGDIPRDIKMNRVELAHTVLDALDKVGVGFWRMVDDEFLGQSDPGQSRGELPTEVEKNHRPRGIDPERLQFLREQPGVLTGLVSAKLGFEGYHAAVFADRIVLEHPEYGNAIYIVYLDHNIMTDPELADRDLQRRLTEEESSYVHEKYWQPIGRQAETRKELRSLPGIKVKKIKHGGKDWKARLATALQEPQPKTE